jgi:hypothetical protein
VRRAVFDDHRTAPVSPRLRAALGLVRKLVERPEEVGPQDVRAVLDQGVSPEAVVDAITVTFAFDMVDRVADSLGFDLLDEGGYERSATNLLKHGYKLPRPLRWAARRNPAW